MNLRFEGVSEESYEEVLALHVAKYQDNFIETTRQCLDEAKELSLWNPTAIYDENKIIGFAMYGFFKSEGVNGRVWLDRFMIDERYQGKGYGVNALKLLISKLYDEYECNEIFLSIYEENVVAIKIYEKLGFRFNGEFDINGEKVMVIKK